MYPQIVAALIIIPVLCGCEGSSAEDTTPMKTATYYTQHLPEAHQVANRCKAMDEQKQRELSAGEYQEWQISNEGVNCQTAISVSEAAMMRELVLKQSRPIQVTPKVMPPPSSAVPPPALRERNDQKFTYAQTLAPA